MEFQVITSKREFEQKTPFGIENVTDNPARRKREAFSAGENPSIPKTSAFRYSLIAEGRPSFDTAVCFFRKRADFCS